MPGVAARSILRTSVIGESTEVKKEPQKPEKQDRIHAGSKRITASVPKATSTSEVPIATPIASSPTYDRSASRLKSGMSRAEVERLFGFPDLRAIGTNRGTLLETYVYDHCPDRTAIIVRLRDGTLEKFGSWPEESRH